MDKFKKFFQKFNNPVTDYILMGLVAFLGTWQIGYLVSLASDYGAAWGFVLSIVFIAGYIVLHIFKQVMIKSKDEFYVRRICFALVISLFFALTLVFGYQLQYEGYSAPGMTGKFFNLLRALCLNFFIFPAVYFIIYKLENIKGISCAKKGELNLKKIFFLSWLTIFVAYIPAFLAYYPMILSYDFITQVLMAAEGFDSYWMHHPYLSTLMIDGFYKLGLKMGNAGLGMSFMGITHMVLSSCAYAYLVTVVARLCPKKWVINLTTLTLALFPTNPVMVLCTTKDVLFSAFFILFVSVGVVRFLLCEEAPKGRKIALDVAVLLSGIMACLWRNNMVYAIAASGLLIFVFCEKKIKPVILLLTVLIYLGNKGGILFLKDVVIHDWHGTNAIEMLSVVVQAFGRTVNYNSDSISEEDKAIIRKYIPEEYWKNYNRGISDPMKSMLVFTYYENIDGQMGTLFKDWLSIGMKYPDQYLDSFLDTTRGFWFIDDTSYADIFGADLEGHMGIIFTYYASESWAVEDIPHQPIWPAVHLFYEKLISRNDVLRWPILNLLFKPAFFTLLTFFVAIYFMYKKDWRKLAFTTIPIMYIGTILLGPVVQYRYVYPWILTSILLTALVFTNVNSAEGAKTSEEA